MTKKKSENMFGSFGAAAIKREHEQAQIEAAVTGSGHVLRKRGAGATTMTLAISAEDKQRVKEYAAKNNTSVSDLLHKWIDESCK